MPLRLEELAKTIDSQLAPEATAATAARLCEEACHAHFAAVCVPTSHVRLAVERLRGCDVKVAAVLPGASADLARRCVAAGAVELDVPLDARALLAGELRLASAGLAAVVRAVRTASVNTGRGHVLVKAVVDGDRLDLPRKQLACRIVEHVDADFAVLATTAPAEDATLWNVELLRERLPEWIALKVSGPVASAAVAQGLVGAGAVRVGTPHAAAIARGLPVLQRAS
jgi:deoxyribose-phosphate aldolase